jgi:hypothetical protein
MHKNNAKGHATVDPFEEVVFDANRAAKRLPPWRGTGAPGERFYLDNEIQPAMVSPRSKKG